MGGPRRIRIFFSGGGFLVDALVEDGLYVPEDNQDLCARA